MRLGFAAVAGLTAELISPDWSTGISIGLAVFLATYYIARFIWYKGADRDAQGKIYSTGIGGFVMVFLFTWMLFFTLQMVGYSV